MDEHQLALMRQTIAWALGDGLEQLMKPHIAQRARVGVLTNDDGVITWQCWTGDEQVNGVSGIGPTPAKACEAFDIAWYRADGTATLVDPSAKS